ncbi:MAG: cyclic nucleotide-binding domain-containing protein [Verrucomicrobiales bacterium]|nr:cyclic nucleotide-binding domain-containing protein [Verrucomicrobiales bacterium]
MGTSFRVFGFDGKIYGPVPTASLLEWAGDGRVQRETWIHVEPGDLWRRAGELDELSSVFTVPSEASAVPASHEGPAATRAGVPAKHLTRLKVFSELTPEELEPFAQQMVEQSFRPFSMIVTQGSHGDAMYFIIQGKVGISTKGQVAESFLVTLGIGDTFGEMSLFDPGPRSADVRAENDVIVLKLSADSLAKLTTDAPVAAGKFLWNIARLLSARIRAMDKKAASAKDMDAAGKAVH